MSAYRLEELGWLGFQRLGELVVGLDRWSGDADRVRELLWEGDLAVPGSSDVLPGPVAVALAWRRDREFPEEWSAPEGARSRLVICNAERVPKRTDLADASPPPVPAEEILASYAERRLIERVLHDL